MSYIGSNIARDTKRAQVESAMIYVAEMIGLDGGEVYLPIFERLEDELEKLSSQDTAIERARRLAQAKRASVAGS